MFKFVYIMQIWLQFDEFTSNSYSIEISMIASKIQPSENVLPLALQQFF